MRFRYTRHARNRIRRDRLIREEIERIVEGSDWSAQGGNRYRVYGESRGRRTRVVLVYGDDDEVTIITAFFDE